MLFAVVATVGIVIAVVAALLMANWWVRRRAFDAMDAIARERGVIIVFDPQEPYGEPTFARFRPGNHERRFSVVRRSMSEHMSWPGDEDAVFVGSITWRSPGSVSQHDRGSHRARVYARVRLHGEVPDMRFGQTGFTLDREWLYQPFGDWNPRAGELRPAQKVNTEALGLEEYWIITAADPRTAADALEESIRRWLIEVAERRTVTLERSNVEMETSGGWLLCDVGPTSLPHEKRLEWLTWAKDAARRLSG